MRICQIPFCGREHEGHGFCHSHLAAHHRGVHRADMKPFPETDLGRFMAKVRRVPSGHWIWIGATASGGRYGVATLNKRTSPAHRVAWMLFRGPIPEGFVVDHLCRKSLCVNPEHLEPKTQRDNILAGDANAAKNAAKTHCQKGHEFTPENTRLYRGRRCCRACERLRDRRASRPPAARTG